MSTSILQYTDEERAYRLKSGSHCIATGDGKHPQVLEPGDVMTTKINMIKLHGPDRWERVNAGPKENIEDLRARIKILEGLQAMNASQAAKDNPDDLSTKTIKQLREMAAAMEPPVELPSNMSKDDIIEAINSAMDAA